MPVKIKSMETAPNGTVSVKLSFPDSELDQFLKWYASGNGKKRTGIRQRKRRSGRVVSMSRKAVKRRKRAAVGGAA